MTSLGLEESAKQPMKPSKNKLSLNKGYKEANNLKTSLGPEFSHKRLNPNDQYEVRHSTFKKKKT